MARKTAKKTTSSRAKSASARSSAKRGSSASPKPAPSGTSSKHGKSSSMSRGAKVAVGAVAGAAVLGAAAAGLATTSTGRNVMRKAGEKARDLKGRAQSAASQVASKTRQALEAGREKVSRSPGKGARPLRTRGGSDGPWTSSGLGSPTLGGASLGGSRSTGGGLGLATSMPAKLNPAGGFGTKPPPISSKIGRPDTMRSAVRGHSGPR